MDEFTEAQRLFGEYERGGDIGSLEESVDILSSLIEEDGELANKSRVFKKTIVQLLSRQVSEIRDRYNVSDFFTGPVPNSQAQRLLADILRTMTKEDGDRVLAIMNIVSEA